jgi:prepilin-type N-terminal cleavage/methylation domain-containing protein/prepilin-type processing-associated H-X9-DG protein
MQVRTDRRGFTLIELLVVIAIIAILAAILFPVFAQARAKARQTSCLSNTKQMDLANQMYAQDYDESFPYWAWWYSSDQGGCPRADRPQACGHFESLWVNAVYPYEKNSGIYACPSDRGELTPSNSNEYWWTKSGNPDVLVNTYGFQRAIVLQQMSYGANEYLLNGGYNVGPKLASIDKPAQTLLLADSITALVCCDGGRRPDRNNPGDPLHKYIMRRVAYANQCDGTWWGGDQTIHLPAWDGEDCVRHSAGANIAFCDGHSKWLRAQNITNDLYAGDQAN